MSRSCLLGAVALVVAVAPAAATAAPIHAKKVDQRRAAGGIVVGHERVTIGGHAGNVTTVTMPQPRRGRVLEPVLPGNVVSDGTATTSAVSRRLARSGTAVAINADLFEYASGQPSGLLMMDGEIFNQPQGGRPALAIDHDGVLTASRPRSTGTIDLGRGRPIPFEVNVKRPRGLVSYDGGWGARIPAGTTRSLIGAVADGSVVRRRGAWKARAVLRTTLNRAGAAQIPPDASRRMLFAGYGPLGRRLRAAHGRFGLRYRLAPMPADARSAVGGGPILVRDGKLIYRRDANREFSDSQLNPPDARTAVAQLRDGRVLFYAVDRGAGSPGFTVADVARDLHRRGARTAMAFDSGGSTAVSVNGRLLNRPADGRERQVGNMLVYYVPDRDHRRAVGAVHVGRRRPGHRVPPLSVTARKRTSFEIDLTMPNGEVVGVHDGRIGVGVHELDLPEKRMRPGRWQLEVFAPRYEDRVVRRFVVTRHPRPVERAAVEVAAREPAPAPAAKAPAATASAAAGGSSAAWIPAGIAAFAAAALAGFGVASMRRR
jgi:hypothetical protein